MVPEEAIKITLLGAEPREHSLLNMNIRRYKFWSALTLSYVLETVDGVWIE
jgi:hypothetical protein